MAVSITATPIVNGVTVSTSATTITASNVAFGSTTASAITSTATGSVTATNVQDAIAQLANRTIFQQDATPSSESDLNEGDLFYDTDDNQLKVYREVSGSLQFVPIMVGNVSSDSDNIDAGAF
tara:strand:- start:996 stop:1364 length:369 start_codon:yes stop_codon:yes gene_type:complete